MDWDGYRVALAVARAGTLAGAARALGVNETTVGRRLARLEAALGAALFDRVEGRMVVTDAGAAVADEAARMELAAEAAAETARGADRAAVGLVRLTAPAVIAQRVLIPRAVGLLKRHPGLRLEIRGEAENRSLLRRETDVAVRLARPEAEPEATARLAGALAYAVYARADAGAAAGADWEEAARSAPWVDYAEAFRDRAPARWADAAAGDAPRARLVVDGAEGLERAVLAGLGTGMLPRFLGDASPELRLLEADPSWTRPVWMVLHPVTRKRARIRVVADWVLEAVRRAGRHDQRPDAPVRPPIDRVDSEG